MSRPAVVYLVMVVVLVAGLWAVLEVGSYLTAPEDLAGKWQIQSTAGDSFGPGMNVEQSGKFFQVAFDSGPKLDLKLQSGSPLVLANSDWKLTVSGHVGSDEKTLQLDGPQQHGRWSAHRTVRTFPPDSTKREAQ